jgi:phosphatidate cytidylyltransferase
VLKHRLITGTILIAAILGLTWLDQRLEGVALAGRTPPAGIVFFALGLLGAALGARELAAVYRAKGIALPAAAASVAAVIPLVAFYGSLAVDDPGRAATGVATAAAAVLALAMLTASRGRTVEGVAAGAGALLLIAIYLGVLPGFLLALRQEGSAWLVLGVVLVTKTCDTGAYFTGRQLGRHKMIPWVSPGKTWEGTAGGVLAAMVVGGLLLPLLADGRLAIWAGVVCGAVFAVTGQLGDLTMSLFKRDAGIKDSSTVLPGLGGVLDVLDSPLLVAPVSYWLLVLFMRAPA